MGRRRYNKPKPVPEFIRTELAASVSKLMENRHKLMCPFPVPAEEVYLHYWTTQQLDALDVLEATHTLRCGKQFVLSGCPVTKDRNIIVTLEHQKPMPREMDLPFLYLPEDVREKIIEWVPDWLRYKEQTNAVAGKVTTLARFCTTFGQLVRIWPELQGFLSELGTEKIHQAKAKSPYPEGVLEWHNGTPTELLPEYRPESFVPLNSMIAECLMLPVIDDLIHVGYVQG